MGRRRPSSNPCLNHRLSLLRTCHQVGVSKPQVISDEILDLEGILPVPRAAFSSKKTVNRSYTKDNNDCNVRDNSLGVDEP
jgi:hypothetical protein